MRGSAVRVSTDQIAGLFPFYGVQIIRRRFHPAEIGSFLYNLHTIGVKEDISMVHTPHPLLLYRMLFSDLLHDKQAYTWRN